MRWLRRVDYVNSEAATATPLIRNPPMTMHVDVTIRATIKNRPMNDIARLLSPVIIALVISSVARGQTSTKLAVPLKKNTGGYHGTIRVSDGVFVNRDQHIVLAINESISVYEARSGKRLHTLLNGKRGRRHGWSVRRLHVVDDGRTLLSDPGGTSLGPSHPEYDPCRWMLWEVAAITDESGADPEPKTFFSRERVTREDSNEIEKDIHFFGQVGRDYVFIRGIRTNSPTIETYLPGDSINAPRQRVSFDLGDDPDTGHLLSRECWQRQIVVGGANSERTLTPSHYLVWRLSHNASGQLHLTCDPSPIEMADMMGEKVQSIVPKAVGGPMIRGGNFHGDVSNASLYLLDNTLFPVRGLPSRDTLFIALSGQAPIWFQNGSYRSNASVSVIVAHRADMKPICRLECGRGSIARPITFSQDGGSLVTVHDSPRPSVRVWRLEIPPAHQDKYPTYP